MWSYTAQEVWLGQHYSGGVVIHCSGSVAGSTLLRRHSVTLYLTAWILVLRSRVIVEHHYPHMVTHQQRGRGRGSLWVREREREGGREGVGEGGQREGGGEGDLGLGRGSGRGRPGVREREGEREAWG